MTSSQDIFTTLKAPTYYPLQTKMGYCGPEQIKAVIESNDSFYYRHTSFYTDNLLQKFTGGMMPWQVVRVLRKYGFRPKIGFLKGKRSKKIDQLKQHLQQGPVILLIGHAYNQKYKFHLLRALLLHHYISIRGYNEKEQIFYAYDSNPDRAIEKNIPIGNSVFAYKDIILYGRYPVAGLLRHMYISLGSKETS